MSISLNSSASSVPVHSHPLSPEDLPGGRPARRRARDQQLDTRPATSYFTPQKQTDQDQDPKSNGYSHHTYSPHHAKRTTADWNGSVRGFGGRKRHGASRNGTFKGTREKTIKAGGRELRTRTSTLSLVWGRPTVPLFIVGSSSTSSENTPGPSSSQRPIFTLGEDQLLHDLPARAASHVLATHFHKLSEADIQSAISDISVLAEEDHTNVKHPYHSALRVLSDAVDKLGRARIELEEGRRRLLEKQAHIRELAKENEPDIRESVLAILDRTTASDSEYESEDENFDEENQHGDGRLSLTDSLSVALSEDLTPTFHDPRSHTPSESSIRSFKPPDTDPSDTRPPPSLLISSESRGSLFTPSTEELAEPAEAASVSGTLSSTRPPRTKSRANSSASLVSMSSTTSRGLGDWMGWFGKSRREPSKLDSALVGDAASVNDEEALETKTADSSIKPTSTMRLLSALRIGSPSSQSSPPKQNHKRKASVTVLPKTGPIPPSALSSPILGTFSVPPPLPAPPVAVIPEQHTDEATDPEATSMLSSVVSPNKDSETGHMQGATLRALSNATRVMTSDPASILVDQDVSQLVAKLAWDLVRGVRDSGVIFREPVKPNKLKVKSGVPTPEQAPEDDGKDGKRKDKAMVSMKNSHVVGAGGTLVVEKTRKASALGALTSPLLGGFGAAPSKTKTPSREEAGAPGNVGAQYSGTSAAAAPTFALAGTLSVPLESIIPATAKPPTQYLARTYVSLISPNFRPPSSFGGFTSDRFATRKDAEGTEPITDRYGFVYEVSSYDVLLLDRALRAGNSAPGCLTGIKVADREEDDDWPAAEDDEERTKEFEVIRGSCTCVEGVRVGDEAGVERPDSGHANSASEVASMVSTSSSRQSSKRTLESVKPTRTLSLSAPLKVASLNHLPVVQGRASIVPTHACPNTVRALVVHITDFHDDKQAKLKAEWNTFLRSRRDLKPVKASVVAGVSSTRTAGSSTAAVMLGLGSRGAGDDVEELRQSEGLVGFSQMGLASNQSERKEFGRLVRGGIPLVHRAKVWLECSGALEMAEPGAFKDLLENAVKEGGVAIAEIEKDVGRTMPLNVFFGGDGVGVNKLRRVLQAYSQRNPAVGYCQGMNLVASTLLLVHADEEDAFWNLSCIIEKHLPEDFFSPSLLVSRACPLVLLDYIHDMMPALFDHLTHLGVDLPAICFSWFLSLFTDCLPVETLFRVWDVFIVDGLDVLFRIALAILRLNETELLQAQSAPALYVALESLPTRMWEVGKLLKHEADLRPYVINADIIKKRGARVKELKDLAA